MVSENRKDLKYTGTIQGTLDVSGHVYNKVSVIGEMYVRGDLDCNRLSVNGTFSDQGTLKAKDGSINGEIEIKKGLESDRFCINGQAEIGGSVDVKDLRFWGTVRVKGNISSEKMDFLGEVHVAKDCNAETFVSKGNFVIGGMLNAGLIDINMYGDCRVQEIGGETVRIKRMRKALFNRIMRYIMPEFDSRGRLETDTIEGDEVYVEYTSAKTVRGNRVMIGKGCEIRLVEYKDSFEKDKDSQVKEHVKTGL